MVELGVNIDHIATVRQARKTYEPDPVWASVLAELGGADCITVHLREDRRHIQDRDVRLLRETVTVKLNLEMACYPSIVDIARTIKPDQVTLVPERREEVTTEGGLDLLSNRQNVERTLKSLQDTGINVSLFLDPSPKQLAAAAELRVQAIELHTGSYALAKGIDRQSELIKLAEAGRLVRANGMRLHAGHGLNYQNVQSVAGIPDMRELNIGHAIVSRAVMVGMERAVREMKQLLEGY
jgi:pyridoxine 5-phosphate synthase